MQAIETGFVTLVGYLNKNYPTDHGNCFTVIVGRPAPGEKAWEVFDRISRRVVNMHYENFQQLFKTGVLKWPVEIVEVGGAGTHCAVTDKRVPEEWKLPHICTLCTPGHLHEATRPFMRQVGAG